MPAAARSVAPQDAGLTYIQARAAAMSGEHGRSAALLAALAESNPSDTSIARKALAEAIEAANMRLAISLARRVPIAQLGVDGRLLLVADSLKRGRSDQALQFVQGQRPEGNLTFLDPLLRAWNAAERRDLAGALATLDAIPANSLARQYGDENRAFILLRFGRSAEAEPFARRAIAGAASRETRLRLAFADAFLKGRDRTRATAMVEGMSPDIAAAADRIRRGRESGYLIATPAEAFGEVLLGVAGDIARVNNSNNRGRLPIGMVQVARYAAPRSGGGAILLALMFEAEKRIDEALAVLRAVPAGDALSVPVRDAQLRILSQADRHQEALALARAAVSGPGATVSDWSGLGDVLQSIKRWDESAAAYERAIALAVANKTTDRLWALHLLRATSLESGDRWPEAKQALQAGLTIEPDQALLLNFLGYAKLERGEDLDEAEAMIRKAVALAPDDASITDSLGWALYKRGKLPDAIETLQRAAASDPTQAEIHEHLGDALFASGRRYEARFAWNAALVTADADLAARVRAKMVAGLTPATAAP
jgi:tetratricopeptide (TPR) repeat protein